MCCVPPDIAYGLTIRWEATPVNQHIVIIGAGECGGRAALSLRERGFTGSLTLIGSEALAPYERPPLSKEAIVLAAEPTFVAEADRYAALAIDLRLGVSATGLDRGQGRVALSDGAFVSYDKLLLATGARPRELPTTSSPSERVRTLRSHADAASIRSCLGPGRKMAIIGGGFIGLELAASARRLGTSVTLIEGLPRILSRGVPGGGGQGLRGGPPPRQQAEINSGGDLRIVTTNFREGYLRKNGVPYSEQATITEYIHRLPTHPNGDSWLQVITMIDDPKYLNGTFYTSTNFRLEPDGSKFAPSACTTDPPLPVKTGKQ